MSVPEVVRDAVKNYAPGIDFALRPLLKNEKSIIYQWGVRVKCVFDDLIGWICLVSERCSNNQKIIRLKLGKTSRANEHLKQKARDHFGEIAK